MSTSANIVVQATPYEYESRLDRTALLVIDMQCDFVERGGFGELLGNDVTTMRFIIDPIRRVLAASRAAGMTVIHTREGHRHDLSDCPPTKLARGRLSRRIGDRGPNGRILVRGERGHNIIEELRPIQGEIIVDKPGKGSFYATDLDDLLRQRRVESLIITGVTTEVCVHSTLREANDRGYECLVLSDCVQSYFPEFQRIALQMISAQGGIFGWVSSSEQFLSALEESGRATAGDREPASQNIQERNPT
jgi:nicotinamidase-related amidase